MDKLNMFWPIQLFTAETRKFTKSATNAKLSEGDILIIHQDGALVLVSHQPIMGVSCTFASNNNGQTGYSSYHKYDIKNKRVLFDELQYRVFS
jgi:hypothetical protein